MMGDDCIKSKALPRGMFSVCGTSRRTTSPSSAAAHQCAQVAPTFPAPMMLIFARRMLLLSRIKTRCSINARTWKYPNQSDSVKNPSRYASVWRFSSTLTSNRLSLSPVSRYPRFRAGRQPELPLKNPQINPIRRLSTTQPTFGTGMAEKTSQSPQIQYKLPLHTRRKVFHALCCRY